MFSPSSNINPCHSLFFDRDHLRYNMAIISGPGSFSVQFGDHLRSGIIFGLGIICGPGSFAVQFGDHLRSAGSFAVPYSTLDKNYLHIMFTQYTDALALMRGFAAQSQLRHENKNKKNLWHLG